jgi:hypothetical protein
MFDFASLDLLLPTRLPATRTRCREEAARDVSPVLNPSPNERAAPKNRLRYLAALTGLAMALTSGSLFAQAPAPELQVAASSAASNVTLRISSRPGWFYTVQRSADLANWSSVTTLFANSDVLTWSNGLAPLPMAGFFRAKVNLPNRAVTANYNGWTNAVLLNNGLVEAVIVPNAGRVLQFRFFGSTNGPFWENFTMSGQTATPSSWNTEGAFGGDKAWPSPQSAWGWPPPAGFDGSPDQVAITNGVVTLTTPVDSSYQVRATRIVELPFNEPVMRITTIFHRVAATTQMNNQLGIWIITQAQDPVRCFVPVPSPSAFADGYHQLGSGLPAQFQDTNGLISFSRDPVAGHKLGFDADSLVWVGTNLSLRIDGQRVPGLPVASYPDGGCSTEVYTNPGTNAPYVELECLAPLSLLPVGAQMQFLTTYTLFHRTESDPQAEARKVLNLPE